MPSAQKNKKQQQKKPDTQEAPVIIMIVNLLDVRQALHRAQHLAKILTVIIAGFKFRKERGDLARTGQLKESYLGAQEEVGSSIPWRRCSDKKGPPHPSPTKKM